MVKSIWYDKDGLRKGEWTPDEDLKLVAYINQHGMEDWRSLPQKAGLQRCGKSCRLRWLNYLRPGIKKGKFTPEEEQLVISLHSQLGNRWAAIAKKMPGRTDNDIKNHWNSSLRKRVARMGATSSGHASPSSSSRSGSAQLLNKLATKLSSARHQRSDPELEGFEDRLKTLMGHCHPEESNNTGGDHDHCNQSSDINNDTGSEEWMVNYDYDMALFKEDWELHTCCYDMALYDDSYNYIYDDMLFY